MVIRAQFISEHVSFVWNGILLGERSETSLVFKVCSICLQLIDSLLVSRLAANSLAFDSNLPKHIVGASQ